MSQAKCPAQSGNQSHLESAHATADQDEVAGFLQDPATHGGAPVERFDTHGAMVFLAGSRAYKVKRAVEFSYMDFSTLAKRQEACEREIALNRRTAPSLYLHTLAITRGRDGGLALGGDGEVVEWAVVMRRFDQDDLLDRMAHEGRLTDSLLTELAEAIARFHDDAEALSTETESGGGSKGLGWAIDESLDELAERPELFPPREVEALAEAARDRLAAMATLLDRRLAQGYVRRCHGDLHLRNICLVDGVPTLFDCIEFNDRIACIDVFYDLAFLLMDLDYLELRPAANLVFNRYLQMTGDLTGPGALPLFLASRALVRAKVGASAAAAQTDAAARASWRNEAGRYFRDARAYLAPAAPRLIAVGGLSGTGKTTLARALAPDLGAAPGAVHLRSDVIRKELCGVGEQDRLPESAYEPKVTEAVYAAILERAGTVLAGGHSVIADAVYARAEERAAVEALARQHSLAFRGLWLSAEADTLVTRVEGRTGDASDATAAVVRRQLDYEIGPIAWQRV
ncbi:MAG: AAA family ATPase, partial [Kiloniellales bacterium]|nr:AAA family ATPase [Kiloniellales bacterium]